MLFFDTKELVSKIKVLPLLKETNFDMTKKRFMKLVTIDAAMSFQEKEDCIFRGLLKPLISVSFDIIFKPCWRQS